MDKKAIIHFIMINLWYYSWNLPRPYLKPIIWVGWIKMAFVKIVIIIEQGIIVIILIVDLLEFILIRFISW